MKFQWTIYGNTAAFLSASGFHTVAVRLQPVILGRQIHILHVGSVPADTAVEPDLLQRHPFPVIGQDHGKAGRAAFQRFHLHNHRHFRRPGPDGHFFMLFSHRYLPPSIPQKTDRCGGFQHKHRVVLPARQKTRFRFCLFYGIMVVRKCLRRRYSSISFLLYGTFSGGPAVQNSVLFQEVFPI